MEDNRETLLINANIEISAIALQAVVENAKIIAGRDKDGRYRLDTAQKTGEMISRFLFEKDFESYAKDISNYQH
ncbi:Uncharacterized protein dnl_26770 [Desulfonema limicola]|uniref:Uncharacterized protein n=1 Tax=Desulfonema limicola TaxID=45656 RepID=A0A975B871_9BACT|nr:hypothetical protein [Desulfonema limicola]QTA80375.1 Uncharacterized protein dnl_26770 [Desulfonema limicola]